MPITKFMLNKRTFMVFLVVMILLASGLAILSGLNNSSSNATTKKTVQATTPQTSPLPAQVAEVHSLQSSMYSSITAMSEATSSTSQGSVSQSPGSVSMSSNTLNNVPQTGYVTNTIDMNGNVLYQGNFQGNNQAGQTAIVYDSANNNIYVAEYAQSNSNLSPTSSSPSYSILILNASTMKEVGEINNIGSVTSMVYDHANGYLYVANQSYFSNGQIRIINTGNNSVVGTIALSSSTYVYNMAVNPGNGTVYATLENSSVAVISQNDLNSPPKFISLSSYSYMPYGIAFDPADNSIYVSMPEYTSILSTGPTINVATYGGVLRINASNYTDMNMIVTGYSPSDLAYSSGTVYAAQALGHNVSVITGSSVSRVIDATYGVVALSANPLNGNLYVSYEGSSSMWKKVIDFAVNQTAFTLSSTAAGILSGGMDVINPSSGAVLHEGTATVAPEWVAFNPSTGTSYASYTMPGKIVSMSTAYKSTTIYTISTPSTSYFDPSNGYLYVADVYAGVVNIYNTSTNNLAATINTGGFPLEIAHNSDGTSVYVTNMLGSSVDVISGLKMVKQYSVGYLNFSMSSADPISVDFQIPVGIAYDSVNNTLYVSDSGLAFAYGSGFTAYNGAVDVISISSGSIAAIPLGLSIAGPIGYSPATNMVYVSVLALISGPTEPGTVVISGTSVNLTASVTLQNQLINSTSTRAYVPVDYAYDTATSSMFVVLVNETSISSDGLFAYASINSTNTLSGIRNLTVPTGGYSTLGSIGANYDPYTGQILLSTFYHFTAPSINSTSFNVTGGVIFINGLNITGYATAGKGTTSAQAINKNTIYTTNGMSGTISVISSKLSSLANLTVNVNRNDAKVFLNTGTIYTTNGHSTVTLNAGYYFLYASSPGYASYSNYIKVVAGANMTVNINLVKQSNYGYFTGSVLPGNAIVTANGVGIPVQNGRFNQSLKAGSYVISISASGYSGMQKVVNITSGTVSNMTFILQKSVKTYEVTGYLMPYKQSLAPYVLFDGVVSFLNQTGYFQTYVTSGTYHISAAENGYVPVSKNVTVNSNKSFLITLRHLPKLSSSVTNSSAVAQGYNATVENVNANYSQGFIGVTFNASSNSTLVISVPLSTLSSHYRNLTLTELINSKVYIGNKLYSNFSITLSSNYTVTLTVYNYTGDPSLYWVFTPYSSYVPASATPPAGISPYLLDGIVGVIVVIAIAGVAFSVTRRRKRGNNGE